MYLSSNLQYLRKKHGSMTQERLAEQMGVSRQTVSKWESGEASPELPKLLELCNIFHCTLDDLLRRDMTSPPADGRLIRIVRIPGFRRAQYVMITANPERDVSSYLDQWAEKNGLLDNPASTPPKIGWTFPYVSAEQKKRFGLRGYAGACILPRNIPISDEDVQLVEQDTADYAVMTIQNPYASADSPIPQAYRLILDHLNTNGIKKKFCEKILPCFEYFYEKEGIPYLDVFVHCEKSNKAKKYTGFQ